METTPLTTTTEQLLTLVAQLETELAEHERAAADIRTTLANFRKRLATTPGARAGKQARSGRKRKQPALPIEEPPVDGATM